MTAVRDERSLGELFSDLSEQTSNLVKKEIELARHEITRSTTDLAKRSAMIAVGGVVAYAGAIVVLMGLGWLLTEMGLPPWLGLLLVGGLTVAIGAFLAYRALNELKNMSVVPDRTVETIKEDVEWAKDQTQ
jgi:hypothetical protein